MSFNNPNATYENPPTAKQRRTDRDRANQRRPAAESRYDDPRRPEPRRANPRYTDPRRPEPHYGDSRRALPRHAGSRYINPRSAHHVNTTPGSETAVFFKLLAKIFIGLIVGLVAIYIAFRIFIPFIPFSFETSISDGFVAQMLPPPTDERDKKALAELQTLAEKLAQHMNVPSDMPIKVHLTTDKEPNAFATLGGNLVITQGLIDSVNSENALAMVMAHELAHLKNRDPLVSLGSGLVFSITLSVVLGEDSGMLGDVVGGMTDLSFSRKQESTADKDALSALWGYYGHTYGAEEFFEHIIKEYEYGSTSKYSDFFDTHPGTDKRLAAIRATQFGDKRPLTPLPIELLDMKTGRKGDETVRRHAISRGESRQRNYSQTPLF